MAGPLNFFRVMQHSQFPSTTIPCNAANVSFSGNNGVFLAEAIVLGNGIGGVTASFNSLNQPDRFQLIWDGKVVADSLFVGDDLIGTLTSYNTEVNTITGTTTQDVYTYNFASNTFTDSGTNETNTWAASDVAPYSNGTTNLRSNGSNGNQVGVLANLPSAATKAADGNITLAFNKNAATPSNFTIKIYGHPAGGTAWSLNSLTCPT